ncbi:MAG: EAL domain-containing protein [Alphaproteobacteria bacterium]|nr:EAL domain-containing protein [Alphaproteobacteria bacterium]MBV9370676.1 EAL domain-containing protein [Alphaproteobacteria bacterium]MBV9900581.1 EAL domain-containing protein [Alphaproteobacteria bacterium]
MLRVYACISGEHDVRLVLLAGLICLLAAITSFALFEQARRAERRRPAWIGLAGFVSGTGIWSTHFVAMLAYRPHLPVGYDLGLTLLSIAAAVSITSLGWAVALANRRHATLGAGAAIGAGIAAMHYVGMSALEVPGRLDWDPGLVAASLVAGTAFSAAALAEHRRKPAGLPWRAALLFTLAICGLHFFGMAAATIYPDSNYSVPPSTIDNHTLTVGVVGMALLILAIGCLLVVFDRKLARNAIEEAQRLRTFADATVEGLVVIDGARIVDANRSFLRLTGYDSLAEAPAALSDLLIDVRLEALPTAADAPPAEARLLRADGESREVELLLRPLAWRGAELRILAVRDISERREAAERIAQLAFYDALTGLPNRGVFARRLAEEVEKAGDQGEPVAVLCIDLDAFKAVNDLYGHAAGDALLIAAAQRLRAAVREHELVARLDGDEFAIVQTGGVQPELAGTLAQRILAALAEPFALGQETVRVTASIGVGLFPADAADADTLIKNANIALCRAKSEARGRARFYEAAMDEALRRRRQLEADLGQALARRELSVHYQPLADLGSGRILGFEALLRWSHKRLGAVSPAAFIPLAEENGFILELGEWVLREACAEAARWSPPLKLSVNLSPLQFTQGDLAAKVEHILAETGLDPARLELEVTEGLLIRDAERALAILRRLQSLGVQISMDDFGTGYSSLSYFRIFPFDKVKIDQSFVREMIESPQAMAIIRSIIGLGRGLGMPVVAEGVETAAQLEALRAEGCDQVQGYLIARPNPIGHFSGLVMDRGGPDLTDRRAAG